MTTTLFVSPHFDDVAWSCVAHVLEARGSGRVLVATVFGAEQPARQREDAAAIALLGCEQGVLPFVDAPERLGVAPSFRSLLLTTYEREAVDTTAVGIALRALVADERIDHVVLPLGVGGHVDHRLTHAVHAQIGGDVTVSFYEDQPYARIAGATASRFIALGARCQDEHGEPLALARPEAPEITRSAFDVLRGLLGASPPPALRQEVEDLASALLATAAPAPLLPALPLRAHRLPSWPARAEAVLRCYASQLPAWFPTDADITAFVRARPEETLWRRA